MSMREQLQADLKTALKQRDETAVTTIRSVLAAIANAEAVAPPEADPAAGSTAPLGTVGLSADVARRDLDADDVLDILRADARERRSALVDYENHGQHVRAEQMRAELDVLARYVDITG